MVLYKRNMEAFNALSILAKNTKRTVKTFTIAGNKDKRAITFQFITCFRMNKETLQ